MITGTGLGLRFKYLDDLLVNKSAISWFELLADHYHSLINPIIPKVDALLSSYPCVMHCVNLSLASSDPLNKDYLNSLDKIVTHFKPEWLSDHLCFSHIGDTFLHDLLPFPFTHPALDNIANKIDLIQTKFKIPFLIENISSYVRFKHSQMTESEFIKELSRKTGCGILLDVNNIVVTCHNHQESIADFCNNIPFDKVMQIHMAGATAKDHMLIDTHGKPMADDVLMLYADIISKHGKIPTCLEWDLDLPEFNVILDEVNKIDHIITKRP